MSKLFKSIALIFIVSCLFIGFASAEDVTITTYYPSPYGSYNELSSNKIRLVPQTQPATALRGDMYYDIDEDELNYWNGDEWVVVGNEVEDVMLARITKSGNFTLTGGSGIKTITGWSVTGGAEGSLYSTYAMEVDLSNYGGGMYEIGWSGRVEVDAVTGRYVQLRLQTRKPGSTTWTTIDSGDQYDDEDGAINGSYTTYSGEPRTVMLSLTDRDYQRFRIVAYQSGADASINPRVLGGNETYIYVNRIVSF